MIDSGEAALASNTSGSARDGDLFRSGRCRIYRFVVPITAKDF